MNVASVGTGRERIEVSYDCQRNGEAYFVGDDMIGVITNGEFQHPYHGRKYRMHVGRTGDVTLEVQVWRTVVSLMPN